MKMFIKGWNKFKFIITPDELEQVFDGFRHVVFQRRVPADYVESETGIFSQNYRNFYEKLAAGYRFEWKRDYKYFDLHMGFTDDLSKCSYGASFQDKRDGKFYKTSKFSEPCVGVSPFALYIADDGKLHTNYSYTQFPEYAVGLQLEYPKLSMAGEEVMTDTFKVYQTICERIKKISKGLVFQSGEKLYKPNVKISSGAREDFERFYFAKHFGCKF